jgi:hypothetical protein
MGKVFCFASSLVLVFLAITSNANATVVQVKSAIPTCETLDGCKTLGWDVSTNQCLYRC